MDPQVQGSFIPKAPLTAPRRRGAGLFMLGALFLFAFSIAAAGAAFGYERYLKAAIAGKDETLKRAEGAFDSGVIRDLVRLDARLTQGRELLRRHVAPSSIFTLLEQETLERVQFTSFDYALGADGTAELGLNGIAADFSTLALQSDRLGAHKALHDVIFSAITVGEGGRVTFTVKAGVDPNLLRYDTERLTTGDQQQTNQIQTSTSSSQTPDSTGSQ